MPMLYPSVPLLLKSVNSRYLLVNVIARRAREIAERINDNDANLDRKPVSIAIDEIASGKVTAEILIGR